MKRAIATDYHPLNLWAADESYAYGTTSSPAQTLERLAHGSRTFETGHDFGSGNQVIRIFTTDLPGEVFVVWEITSSGQHYLARSINYGVSFSDVLTFGAVDVYLLSRGLTVGYPGGVRTYALAEYVAATGPVDARIMVSTDGKEWTQAAAVVAGSSEIIRHWHNIAWNPYNEYWYLCSGDTNAQSMVLRTQDLALIPTDTVANILATPGIQGKTGTQRCRTVEFLFTESHVFTASDTIAGPVSQRGVIRWTPDLQVDEQVDTGDGKYTDGSDSRSTMWIGVKAENHLLFGTYEQTDVPGEKHLEIFAAQVGQDGPGQWREVARVYTRNGTTSDMRGFWYARDRFGFCFGRGAGKQTQNETAIFKLDGLFTDDVLKESAITGEPIYIPDTIHPVYWLSESAGNDANNGYTPDTAWRSFTYAMRGTPGAGNKTISGITESAGLATVTTSSDHGYAAGTRVTLAGNTPSAYNNTWVILDAPTSVTFRIRVPSGTGATSVNGTANDIASMMTYGGKLIIDGTHPVPTSFNINIAQFPNNTTVSGIFGMAGESGHPVFLEGTSIADAVVYGLSTTSGVGPFALNAAADFLIVQNMHIYNERTTAGSRALNPAVAGSKVWARDCKIGNINFNAQVMRVGAASDQAMYFWRVLAECDGAGGAANQPAFESDGTAVIHVMNSIIRATYRGVRLRTVGSSAVVKGCYVYGYSLAGFDSVAANNTGRMEVVGSVFVSGNGSASSINSGTGTFTGGFRAYRNLTDRTPSQTKDRSGIDLQVLGTTLADYFVGGDPLLGALAGSAVIESGGWVGPHDYTGARRKNPSSIGPIEYRSGQRVEAIR
jgi:hypothetical protein